MRKIVLISFFLILICGTCYANDVYEGSLGFKWEDSLEQVDKTATANNYMITFFYKLPDKITNIDYSGTVENKHANISLALFDDKLYTIDVKFIMDKKKVPQEFNSLKSYLSDKYGGPTVENIEYCSWHIKPYHILLSTKGGILKLFYTYTPLYDEAENYKEELDKDYYKQIYNGL